MDGDQSRERNADSQFITFDFSPTNQAGSTVGQLETVAATHQPFNNLPNDTTGIGIIEDLQGIPAKDETPSRNFWTIEYYQKFFNVDTKDVMERLWRSVTLYGRDNYFITHIRPNPDLYGPFWICMTLVISIAMSENEVDYWQSHGYDNIKEAMLTKYYWRYNFHVVTYAITCVFLYAWLLPLALWGMIKWISSSQNTEEELIEAHALPGFLELLCLYGYSLAIYVPLVFLWMIQISWLQWTFLLLATSLSGGVLLRSLLPIIANNNKQRIIYVAVILGMHLLLAVGLMLYFFHVNNVVGVVPVDASTTSTTQVNLPQNNGSTVAAVSAS